MPTGLLLRASRRMRTNPSAVPFQPAKGANALWQPKGHPKTEPVTPATESVTDAPRGPLPPILSLKESCTSAMGEGNCSGTKDKHGTQGWKGHQEHPQDRARHHPRSVDGARKRRPAGIRPHGQRHARLRAELGQLQDGHHGARPRVQQGRLRDRHHQGRREGPRRAARRRGLRPAQERRRHHALRERHHVLVLRGVEQVRLLELRQAERRLRERGLLRQPDARGLLLQGRRQGLQARRRLRQLRRLRGLLHQRVSAQRGPVVRRGPRLRRGNRARLRAQARGRRGQGRATVDVQPRRQRRRPGQDLPRARHDRAGDAPVPERQLR